ncbi:hypothetical protein MPER_10854, partial [Moniliophthora perniciosa FA553]
PGWEIHLPGLPPFAPQYPPMSGSNPYPAPQPPIDGAHGYEGMRGRGGGASGDRGRRGNGGGSRGNRGGGGRNRPEDWSRRPVDSGWPRKKPSANSSHHQGGW